MGTRYFTVVHGCSRMFTVVHGRSLIFAAVHTDVKDDLRMCTVVIDRPCMWLHKAISHRLHVKALACDGGDR